MLDDVILGEDDSLRSFSKEAWRDVAKAVDSKYSDERFDKQWEEFLERKALLSDIQGNA